jgi:hypothetical protein
VLRKALYAGLIVGFEYTFLSCNVILRIVQVCGTLSDIKIKKLIIIFCARELTLVLIRLLKLAMQHSAGAVKAFK